MPREVFVAGQILTAAEMNIVSDQTVMSFAGTAARGSAIPTPVEGMVAYLNDTDALTVYNGSSWVPAASGATLGSGSILQVVSTTKTDTFSTSSTSYTNLTGLSASITPSSTANKVLVLVSVSINPGGIAFGRYEIRRDSTTVGSGVAVGNRSAAFASFYIRDEFGTTKLSGEFLDAPSSTSSLTYQIRVAVNTGTLRINTTGDDSDQAANARTSSSITLMEVAG